MKVLRQWAAPLAGYVIVSVLFFSLQVPTANAAMVTTDALLRSAQVQQDRLNIEAALDRADVHDALAGYGVDPTQIQARLDALSDDELHALATNIDNLPAAGTDPLSFLLFIFIVLLITDILGFTQVFPFVKHRAR